MLKLLPVRAYFQQKKKLWQGASQEDLLRSYPRLSQEDIYAALQYATARIANEEDLEIQL